MITEALVRVALGFVAWVATLFPDWQLPDWVSSMQETELQLLQTYHGLGVWVDWAAMGWAISAVAATYGIGFGIRMVRALLAHIPQFGGSGA